VSQVISQEQVVDLPLNGRNFTELLLLGGGAYKTSGGQSSGARPLNGGDIGIAGARYSSTSYLLDGMTNRDIDAGPPILMPSIDAIQEFKEQTGTYSAQYGSSAIQVNLHFKSGTNQLHGTGYDFIRNDAFDARNFFDGPSIAKLRQNQFGYSLGGPVYIPKLYDGKNKSFFFANYEALRTRQDANGYVLVPNPNQLQGNFSSLTTPILDPSTGLPFAGNLIPSSRISAFATEYRKYFLTPNTNAAQGNWFGDVSTPTNGDQQTYRFDQIFGPKDTVFFRYTTNLLHATTGGPNATGDSGQTTRRADVQNYQGSYTRTVKQNIVNQFQIGYIYADNASGAPLISAASLAALGIKGGFPSIPSPELPLVSFVGDGLTSGGTDLNYPTLDHTSIWDTSDSLNIVKGAHTLNFGFSYRNWVRTNGKGANLGDYGFNGYATGNPVADFLLGLPASVEIPQPTPLAQAASQVAFKYPQFSVGPYVEDSWKVNRQLTVTAGLRYDFYSLPREQNNRWWWLDPTVPGGGICFADKQVVAAGAGGDIGHYCGSTTPGSAQKSVFAPRVGMAFQPVAGGKTVIRSGWGIFYDTPEQGDDVNVSNIYPFFQNGGYQTGPGLTPISLSQPFPSVTSFSPVQPSQLGFVFSAPLYVKNPYYEQWSFTVERQLASSTKLEVGYLGSEAHHLPTRIYLNQPYPYDPANPTSFVARQPYPNFGDLFGQEYRGNSNYNALNVRLEHRSGDLTLLAVYTWSRSMDDRSAQFGLTGDANGWSAPLDSRDMRLDYARSTFDVPQRFVGSFMYQIPVGKGKRIFNNMPRPVDLLAGNWQVNGIVTVQTGFPFTIEAADLDSEIGTFAQRANVSGNPLPSGLNQNIDHWFNTSVFSQPAIGRFGNTGRNILNGPGLTNVDLSLFKSIPVTERLKLQLRFESFNLFNHAQFQIPDNDVNSPTFGVIGSANPGRIIQLAGKIIW
jgi:hypothetical protein